MFKIKEIINQKIKIKTKYFKNKSFNQINHNNLLNKVTTIII